MKYEGEGAGVLPQVGQSRAVGAKVREAGPSDGLRERTKSFALRIIKLNAALPLRTEARVIGSQLLRSGTSVGAQFREACRAKSDADYISKMTGSIQELDESSYWMELLSEAKIFEESRMAPLINEANELIAIFTTIVKRKKASMGLMPKTSDRKVEE